MNISYECFDYISTLVAVIDVEGKIEYVNKYITEHTQEPLESFTGKYFQEFGSMAEDKKNMQDFVDNMADKDCSYRLIIKSTVKNKKYWVEWSSEKFAGDGYHFIITGRVLSEYREMRFKGISDPLVYAISQGLEKAPFIVMIADQNWNIQFVNEEFEKSTGFSYQESLGKRPEDILADKKSSAKKNSVIDEKLEKEGKWTGELYNVKKSGEAYIEYGSILVLNGIAGNKKYYLKVTFDFSQKLSTEIKLKELFKKNEAIMEILPDPVFIIDRNGKYLDYIAKPHEKLAIPRNIIIGKTIFDTPMTDKDKKKTKEIIENSLDNQKSYFYEYSFPNDTGGRKYYEGWVVPINNDEVLFLARDITLDKEHKKFLKEAKEAAEMSDRAKSKFLANTNHELRTPLTVIMGAAETLIGTDLTPEQKGFAETIRNYGKSLLSMINNILDVTKIESGMKKLEEEPFNIRTLMDNLMSGLRIKADKKNLKFKCKIDDGIPAILLGDQVCVKQIVFNLVGNAIKFTEKGRVEISIEHLRIEDDFINMKITVEDTGIGISEDDYEKIFNPFSQANSSIHKKYGGTGLGLTISKKIIEEMNGKIEVESQIGRGSKFIVVLPLKYLK